MIMGKQPGRLAIWLSAMSVLAISSTTLPPHYASPAFGNDVFSISAAKDGKADSSRTQIEFGSLSVGAKKSDNVLISNTGSRSLVLLVFARFTQLAEDGQTTLISATDSKPFGMASWALFGSKKAADFNVTVAAGKSVVVPIEITVPKDAYPGGYKAAILVQTTLGTGNVAVGKRVAMYMTANVAGSLRPAVNPTWMNDSVFYEMNIRQYSATRNFAGAAARLKELKTLGVEAVIINPIFPIGKSKMVGTLGSVFASTDLSKVNPSLGTATSFKSFMTSAKASGLKVLLTVPLETAAIDHQWSVSKSSWFKRNSAFNLEPVPSKEYLAYYEYQQEELRQAMIEDLKSWVTGYDIDGFIFSGATSVPRDFLDELTFRLQRTKSLALGTTDAIKSDYFTNSLTLTSNRTLLDSLALLRTGTRTKAQLTTLLNSEVSKYKSPSLPLNHLSSYVTMEGGQTETARFAASLSAAAMLSFTMPGAPVIFQGQEVGSIKALKPFDSDFIVWPTRAPATFAQYQKLIKLKKANAALFNEKFGGTARVLTTTSNSLFAFSRSTSTNTVLVVVNLSSKTLKARFNSGVTGTQFKYSDGRSVRMTATSYELTLPAFGFEIFTKTAVK